jgi:murein DD-endopeptidase MepM/ murein hydrolase activator NlpD
VLTEDQPSQEAVARASASSQAGWKVTDAASDDEAVELAALSTAAEVEPESAVAPTVPTNLMAAAPMDPDVYRASPQVPVGETVSPGMPILPESGEYLPEAPNRFNGYVWPAQGTLTSGYGWRWGRMHRGIDIAGPVGTPIMAAASGVVVRSGWNSGGYGNLVDIRHADGSLTRYAHNSRLLVREGQQVRQGQQIAEMGSTGYSTGPHVHFEVHLPNTGTVNPMAHLPGR